MKRDERTEMCRETSDCKIKAKVQFNGGNVAFLKVLVNVCKLE